ncbi:MAG TPA: hypothetical protein VNN74_00675 [Candidatus Micrarchaeia archaeon]|nr:hypothetical protein [Candidatus Micrarchaeia archaeon]
MEHGDGLEADGVGPREVSRVRRRARRRTTPMVVDNGGVKRIQLALRERARRRSAAAASGSGSGDQPSS